MPQQAKRSSVGELNLAERRYVDKGWGDKKEKGTLSEEQGGGGCLLCFYLLFAGIISGEGAIWRPHPQCQSESHYWRGHRRTAPGKLSLDGLLRSHFHLDKEK